MTEVKATLPSWENKPLSIRELIKLRFQPRALPRVFTLFGWLILAAALTLTWPIGERIELGLINIFIWPVVVFWAFLGTRSFFSPTERTNMDLMATGKGISTLGLRQWRNMFRAAPLDYHKGRFNVIPEHGNVHEQLRLAMRKVVRSGSNAMAFRLIDYREHRKGLPWSIDPITVDILEAFRHLGCRRTYSDVLGRVDHLIEHAGDRKELAGIHREFAKIGIEHVPFWIYRYWDNQAAGYVIYIVTEELFGYFLFTQYQKENRSAFMKNMWIMSAPRGTIDASDEEEPLRDHHDSLARKEDIDRRTSTGAASPDARELEHSPYSRRNE